MVFDPNMSIYYIDPSILVETELGDGSAPDNANNKFPETLYDNTIYLIRRTKFLTELSTTEKIETYVPLPTGTFSLNKIAIVGVPKPTDPDYDQLPAAVKELWGNDEAEYAQLLLNTNDRQSNMVIHNCNNFKMSRVCLMENNSNSDYYGDYLICLYDGCVADVEIDNCMFKNKNFDLSDLTTNESIHEYQINRFLNLRNSNHSNIIKITNSTIQSSGTRPAINLGYTQNIVLENITSYGAVSHDDNFVFIVDHSYHTKHNLFINNITHYDVSCSVSYKDSTRTFINDQFINKCEINNVSSSVVIKGNVAFNNLYTKPVIDIKIYSGYSNIQNINISNPYINGLNSRFIYVACERSNQDRTVEGQYITLRDITLTAADTRVTTERATYNVDPFDRNSGTLLQLVISTNDSTNMSNNPSNIFLVQRCTISAYAGIALRAQNALIDFNEIDILGCVELNTCVGKIKSVKTWYPGRAVVDSGHNLIYINTIMCNRQNEQYEYNGNEALSKSFKSKFLVTSCNTKFTNLNYNSTNHDGIPEGKSMYVCTNNITTGNYTVSTPRAYAQTWSIFRNGGTECSLKLVNECADNVVCPLILGGDPFKGFKFKLDKNEATLKIYCTLFNYNTPNDIFNHLKAKITLPDGSIVWSGVSGYWKLDGTSIWNNVDNNTSYCLNIPVTSTQTGDGYIEYYFDFYQNDASTYLDPYPEIV